VVWYRASGGVIKTDEFTLTPSTDWVPESRTVTAPQNAASMTIQIEATASDSADGNVYIDEITIDLVGQIFRVDSGLMERDRLRLPTRICLKLLLTM